MLNAWAWKNIIVMNEVAFFLNYHNKYVKSYLTLP